MERKCQTRNILWRSFLTLTLFAISDSIALRLDDSQVRYIPLTRKNLDGGFRFLRRDNFRFEKEISELNELRYRFRRSNEGSFRVHNKTKISEEFELTGDNHTVAFLHWSGKNSSVSFVACYNYACNMAHIVNLAKSCSAVLI